MTAERLDALRAQYRREWDAHQLIADHNARLEQSGRSPSNEHLINEQRAAEAVARARDNLLVAIATVKV